MMRTHNGCEGVVHVTFTHVSLAKASYVANPEDTGWESIILTQRRTADLGTISKPVQESTLSIGPGGVELTCSEAPVSF